MDGKDDLGKLRGRLLAQRNNYQHNGKPKSKFWTIDYIWYTL